MINAPRCTGAWHNLYEGHGVLLPILGHDWLQTSRPRRCRDWECSLGPCHADQVCLNWLLIEYELEEMQTWGRETGGSAGTGERGTNGDWLGKSRQNGLDLGGHLQPCVCVHSVFLPVCLCVCVYINACVCVPSACLSACVCIC